MDHVIKDRIQYLLDRCLEDQMTSVERQEFDVYAEDERYALIIQEGILQAFHKEKPLVDMSKLQQDQILEAIYGLESIEQTTVRHINYRWVGSVAAAILFFFFFLVRDQCYEALGQQDRALVTQKSIPVHGIEHQEDTKVSKTDYKPAKEQAILTLADGEKLLLDQMEVGSLVERNNFSLVKLDAGKLVFRFKDIKEFDRKAFQNMTNTLVTPRGGIYSVILGDGTKVQMNASSRLTFPVYFSGDKRLVQLEGEAFFEVSSDNERQFIVQSGKGTNQQEVLVYGTTFNISAYPEDNILTTTLVEGSVKLRQVKTATELFLKPMQQATLKENGIKLDQANLDVNLAWVNRLFYFANNDIDEVLEQLSRWYDVDFKFSGSKISSTFWGQISRDKMLSEVLDILEKTNDLKFEVKGKEVTVMKK